MKRQIRVGYLVTGIVFVGIAAVWLARVTGLAPEGHWAIPLVLVVAGVIGLAVSLGSRPTAERRTTPTDAPSDLESPGTDTVPQDQSGTGPSEG